MSKSRFFRFRKNIRANLTTEFSDWFNCLPGTLQATVITCGEIFSRSLNKEAKFTQENIATIELRLSTHHFVNTEFFNRLSIGQLGISKTSEDENNCISKITTAGHYQITMFILLVLILPKAKKEDVRLKTKLNMKLKMPNIIKN